MNKQKIRNTKAFLNTFAVFLIFSAGLIIGENSYFGLVGEGDSMLPTMKSGDSVVCLPLEYETNDIVIFRNHNEQLVIHRVVGINSHKILTKGDNNYTPDISIPKDNVVCKVVLIRVS